MNKITDDMQIFEVGDKLYFDTEKSYINQASVFIIGDIIETDIITYLSLDNEFKLHNSWIDFDKTLKAMGKDKILRFEDGYIIINAYDRIPDGVYDIIYDIEEVNLDELFLSSKLTIEPIKNSQSVDATKDVKSIWNEVIKQWEEPIKNGKLNIKESLEELKKTIEIKEQYIIKLKAITKARDEIIIKNDEIIKKLEDELKNREEIILRIDGK